MQRTDTGSLAFLLALAASASAAAQTPTIPSPPAGDEVPAAAYAEAEEVYGVPEPLLRALVAVESGGGTRGGAPTLDGRYGVLGLRPGATLEAAAERTGFDAAELATDPRAGLLGGAAVLAELATDSRSLEETLARWSGYDGAVGADYAREVRARLEPLEDYRWLTWYEGPGWRPLDPPPFEASTKHRPDYPEARWVGPACDYTNASRGSGSITMVIIHTCEGGFSGCWGWLSGCHDVSAHYVVSNGGAVVQIVEDEDIAWHAGCVNGRSIGIEHEGSSLHPENFTHDLYCASARLVRFLCDRYGFACDRSHVIGHGEANDLYCGGTHWDPGPGWDWSRYMEYVRCGCAGCCVPSPETCNDRDDDCDGEIDEGLTRDCGTDVGACEAGRQTCRRGDWGNCAGEVGPAPERCNDLDDDCDAETDDEQVCELEELTFQAALLDEGGSTDVDGDGRADACARDGARFRCHLASGRDFATLFLGPALDAAAWDDPGRGSTLRLADLDADGRADLCARDTDGIACWRSEGDAFGRRLTGPPLSDAAGWAAPERQLTLRLADVTGDGRDDLCARAADGFRCWPSAGSGFDAPWLLADLADGGGWDEVSAWGTLRLGDVDGDGRADLCARDAGGVRCWLAGERGWTAQLVGPTWSDDEGWGALSAWSTIRLVDIDGDGRADLCARDADGVRCHRSTGAGFGGPLAGPPLGDDDGWSDRSRFPSLRYADVDGDGTRDLCARDAGGVACWLWTGDGFARRLAGPRLADVDGWSAPERLRTLRLADVTGDGRADVCARTADGLRCWVADGGGFPTALRGPAWTDDDWSATTRHATLRLAGPRPAGATTGTDEGGGCDCSAAGADGRAAPAAGLLALLGLVVRRRRRR